MVQQWRCEEAPERRGGRARAAGLALALAALALAGSPPAAAQRAGGSDQGDENVVVEDDRVQLDFNDVELSVVIDTISRLTGRNMIYDDRVRGRVTIVSPTPISVDAAYAVFESVLQVKGFTTVEGPGGAIKIIPLREAKESSIETATQEGPPPESDRFITRLIPLQYISAEDITNTLSPLVSKDASMVAYPPTNTVILTDSASNIRRVLDILQAIDVKTYKEELTVIKVEHADATSLAEQLSEIFDAQVSAAGGARSAAVRRRRQRQQQQQQQDRATQGGEVRIITDERTNSLVIMASRQRTRELRRLIDRLDVPVSGGGRIHVYYLKHANAEDMAETLNNLIGEQRSRGAAGGGGEQGQRTPQALRAAITELAEGVTITADAPTNSLVIQASQEGYRTLSQVVDLLDIARPQVLVEALIMEVDVTDSEALGFSGLVEILSNDETTIGVRSLGSGSAPSGTGGVGTAPGLPSAVDLIAPPGDSPTAFAASVITQQGDSVIQAIIDASATDNSTNIISAPHILTSDNEEAEIQVGNNIPIITSRVQSAAGIEQTETGNLATSVNVERQDIGVTLRVTPQISEGDQLRMEIFQEITNIASGLQGDVGNRDQVGVALSNRTVENTVVVGHEETVVIGGLVSDDYSDNVTKVPFLGDIPVLGWLFKTTSRQLTKQNLLVFLTPHIIRKPTDLERESIRKREEFRLHSEEALGYEGPDYEQLDIEPEDVSILEGDEADRNPALTALKGLERRFPLQRMRAIEKEQAAAAARAREEARSEGPEERYGVLAGTFRDEEAAAETLQELIDAGLDGTLVTEAGGDEVRMEVRLGPYPTLERAEEAAALVREGFPLSPEITVERGDAGAEEGGADEAAAAPREGASAARGAATGEEATP